MSNCLPCYRSTYRRNKGTTYHEGKKIKFKKNEGTKLLNVEAEIMKDTKY